MYKRQVERYGTAEQLEEYRRQTELRGTPEHKAKNWMGSMLFHLSHANDVDHAWASSRTREELDQIIAVSYTHLDVYKRQPLHKLKQEVEFRIWYVGHKPLIQYQER